MKIANQHKYTISSKLNKAIPFPNAASKRSQYERLLDTLLTAISGLGFAVGMLFLFTAF